MADDYEILGLKRGASPQEIKRAYFTMVRKYSPEKDPEKFREIRDAYEHLQKMENDQGPDLPGPTEPVALMMLKEIERFRKQGNKERVRDACEEAHRRFPDEIIFLYMMMMAQREAGNTGKAVKNAELLVEKEPDNKWFWRELAISYMERGYTQKAFRAFEKGYELGCRDNDFILTFSQECRDYGEYDTGIKILFEMLHRQKRWEREEIPEAIEAYYILLDMDYAGRMGYFQKIVQELIEFLNRYSVYIEENLKLLVSALAAFSAMSEHTLEKYQTIDRLHQLLERICHSSNNIIMLKKVREYCMFEWIGYDERLSDTVKRGVEAFLEMADIDAVLLKYAKLDVKLCMIEERQEILPQLEILKKEYSPYYEKEEDFFRQLESGQGLEELKQKLLKPYSRLSGEVSGGFYFEKYPQEAIRGRGKVIHAGTESSPYERSGRKIGRNEPCPCGSGRKYKHCCGRK